MCNLMFCIIGIFFILALLVLFAITIYLNNKHRKKLEEITQYQINVSAIVDKSIPEILDFIIQGSFMDYRIIYLDAIDEGYINEEKEIQIRDDFVKFVSKRISNAALDKLSLVYNPANIGEIIADKIYIIIMNYVTEHNSAYVQP